MFGRPTNDAWPAIYDFYWETMVPLSLSLWALSIGLVIFFETTSHLFSSYHRSKLKRRAFSGLLGVLSWWWIAAISLRFFEALTDFLVPSLTEIELFQTLSFSAMGVLGIVIALFTHFTLFVLIALIYFMRHVVLYLFVLMMPLLIVLWIPGVGPFTLVSRFVQRLAGFFVPFLFMTVPVALLFRLGDLLGSHFSLSMGGFGAWLTALVIPLVAVISPFILFWQAGALFFMAERATHHVSANRARRNVARSVETGRSGRQGGRNFARGVRGESAIQPNGQTVLGSGNSRAHAMGTRVGSSANTLKTRLSVSTVDTPGENSRTGSSQRDSRNDSFETMRSRSKTRSSKSREDASTTDPRDERPYYID